MSEVLKKYVTCYSIAIIFILILLVYSLFCRGNVSDNKAGADTIGEQLGHALQSQQNISSGISDAQTGLDDIESRIDNSQARNNSAKERANKIEVSLERAGAVIAESQQILRDVRARNEKEK